MMIVWERVTVMLHVIGEAAEHEDPSHVNPARQVYVHDPGIALYVHESVFCPERAFERAFGGMVHWQS